MSYEPFFERFGELALKETRSVTVFENHPALPADEYGLIELYCNDKNCDCRRVMFDVTSRKRNESVAVVAYGWENEAFYQKWFGGTNAAAACVAINEMMGLTLNSMSNQTELAPAILEMVWDVLQDPAYVSRIKRHYRMFREMMDAEYNRKPAAELPAQAAKRSRKRHRPSSGNR